MLHARPTIRLDAVVAGGRLRIQTAGLPSGTTARASHPGLFAPRQFHIAPARASRSVWRMRSYLPKSIPGHEPLHNPEALFGSQILLDAFGPPSNLLTAQALTTPISSLNPADDDNIGSRPLQSSLTGVLLQDSRETLVGLQHATVDIYLPPYCRSNVGALGYKIG